MKYFTTIFRISLICMLVMGGVSLAQELAPQPNTKINIERNIRYDVVPESYSDSSSDRRLDIYRPEGVKGKLPVLLFVHGGGFAGGDKSRTPDLFTKISSAGYAVISMNYRLYLIYNKPNTPQKEKFYPEKQKAVTVASEDAVSALKWIKENAKQYNLDAERVAIAGGSAGAMTALYTAYISNQDVLPIKAVVNLWGGLKNSELIKKNAPPVLTYHGDKDATVKIELGYALHKRMDEIGSRNSIFNIMEGKGHAQYKYIIADKVEEILSFLRKNI